MGAQTDRMRSRVRCINRRTFDFVSGEQMYSDRSPRAAAEAQKCVIVTGSFYGEVNIIVGAI